MKIARVWAMPNRWTFQIKPIRELLTRYVGDGKGWADPFAGENSPAEITNDLNPNRPTLHHEFAHVFAQGLNPQSLDGVLFDPPYNLSQIKECYDGIGAEYPKDWMLDASFGQVKDILADKIKDGGIAISFGWNSNGFGHNRGFQMEEILLVPHGGHHYDTIVVVERRIGALTPKKKKLKTDITNKFF